jgi:putative DNA primase/helicase
MMAKDSCGRKSYQQQQFIRWGNYNNCSSLFSRSFMPYQFAQENGFTLPTLIFDGSIHRFARNGKKDNCWYVAHESYSPRYNERFIAVIFGDWATQDQFKFTSKPSKPIPQEEIDARIKQIDDDRKKREAEIELQRKRCKEKATYILLNGIDTAPHSYMKKKGFDHNYGAKIYKGLLAIPMLNIDGEIVGAEMIDSTGGKKYLAGTNLKGAMFSIPSRHDYTDVLVCEGFATAVSCHLATGLPSIVCFTVSNIENVARHIKEKHPECIITICGDNDAWTAGNPGLTTSKAVARKHACFWCVPQFINDDTEPTDFNDLHALEGLKKVRSQISKAYKFESRKEYLERCKLNFIVAK